MSILWNAAIGIGLNILASMMAANTISLTCGVLIMIVVPAIVFVAPFAMLFGWEAYACVPIVAIPWAFWLDHKASACQ